MGMLVEVMEGQGLIIMEAVQGMRKTTVTAVIETGKFVFFNNNNKDNIITMLCELERIQKLVFRIALNFSFLQKHAVLDNIKIFCSNENKRRRVC